MPTGRAAARLLAPPLIAAILAVNVDGCASGARGAHGIGTPLDPVAAHSAWLVRVPPGTVIELTRRDGTVVRGRFRGIVPMGDEAYARHWEEFARARGDSLALPRPGAWLELRPRRGAVRGVRFDGFELGAVEVSDSAGVTESVPFARLAELREPGGRSWSREQLIGELLAGRLPASSLIRLEVGSGEITLPADDVAEVERRSSGVDELTGVIAVVGGVLIIVTVVAWATAKPKGPSCDVPPPQLW